MKDDEYRVERRADWSAGKEGHRRDVTDDGGGSDAEERREGALHHRHAQRVGAADRGGEWQRRAAASLNAARSRPGDRGGGRRRRQPNSEFNRLSPVLPLPAQQSAASPNGRRPAGVVRVGTPKAAGAAPATAPSDDVGARAALVATAQSEGGEHRAAVAPESEAEEPTCVAVPGPPASDRQPPQQVGIGDQPGRDERREIADEDASHQRERRPGG